MELNAKSSLHIKNYHEQNITAGFIITLPYNLHAHSIRFDLNGIDICVMR